jgi:hypothetical protein
VIVAVLVTIDPKLVHDEVPLNWYVTSYWATALPVVGAPQLRVTLPGVEDPTCRDVTFPGAVPEVIGPRTEMLLKVDGLLIPPLLALVTLKL